MSRVEDSNITSGRNQAMAKLMPVSAITACESCRSRKVKCDKVHPRCGQCVKHSFDCVFVHERLKRGPRKGELDRLKAQVTALKQKLAVQEAGGQLTSPVVYAAAPSEVASSQAAVSEHATGRNSQTDLEPHHSDHCSNLVSDVYTSTGTNNGEGWDAGADPEFMAWLDLTLPSTEPCLPMEPSSRHSYTRDMGQPGISLDRMVKADLEATYFERAHPFIPLLHKNRFHSWADFDVITPSQNCLRAAVWTIAAALCPRFHDMYMSLYTHTRQLLQALDGGHQGHLWAPVSPIELEQIQAWLLIGHCDFIRHDRHVAILSATRISRLVQAARFNLQHTGDNMADDTGLLTPDCAGNSSDVTLKEERGRAFWVAFCFDRMVHSLDHCHFTLQDETAYLSLPWPEAAYQASEPTVMHTLTDALEAPRVDVHACFAESIVAVTLYGRCLTHRRLAAAAKARKKPMSSGPPDMHSSGAAAAADGEDAECQRRHAWLVQALDLRLRSSTGQSPLISAASTPLLVLANLLNHGCAVHLLETLIEHVEDDPELHVDQVYNAYDSVVNIAQFTTTLPQATCFKMHPLVPIVLSGAFNFLKKYRYILERDRDRASINQTLQCLVLQLEKFEDVHIVAKDFLEKHRSDAW